MAKVVVGDFEWDSKKEALNRRKHRISFVEAITVFDDPLFVIYYSSDHSKRRTVCYYRAIGPQQVTYRGLRRAATTSKDN